MEELAKAQDHSGGLSDAIFIPNPQKSRSPILGPTFKELPLAFTVHYPVFEACIILRDNADVDWVHRPKKNFICWPVFDANWSQWTVRMFAQKSEHLEKVGLKNLLRLLRTGITPNPSLIQATLAFWDPSYNCFCFNYGMIAPIVFVVSHLLGFIPHGPLFDISASSSISFTFPNLIPENSSYTRFLTTEMRKIGDVSDRKFFSYLLYTLCKYILCHGSKKVMSEMIPLALRFLEGKPFDFASYFLGNVYKVGSDCQGKPLTNQSFVGPIWFFQLWLLAYFPECPTSTPQHVYVHGEKIC